MYENNVDILHILFAGVHAALGLVVGFVIKY